jgi:hypothetical protein
MKFIGIAGRKRSGKDTVANYLKEQVRHLLKDELLPSAKVYRLADGIREFCVDYLGVPHDDMWMDDRKDKPTHLRWEDLPHYDRIVRGISDDGDREFPMEDPIFLWNYVEERRPKGYLTVRQVLQQIGEMMCWLHPTIWIDRLKQRMDQDYNVEMVDLAIICDVRKPIEIEHIQGWGGKVMWLPRCLDPTDRHYSEVALLGYTGFDAVLLEAGEAETCQAALQIAALWT